MLSIKIKRKILSPNLRVSELKDFVGKYVEITVKEIVKSENKSLAKSAAGTLSNFSNSEKIILEKKAWQMSAQEKHGNS
jgi:hypothetical protein